MQIQPTSFAFTLPLGFLAAVLYSGIDISLPALAAAWQAVEKVSGLGNRDVILSSCALAEAADAGLG